MQKQTHNTRQQLRQVRDRLLAKHRRQRAARQRSDDATMLLAYNQLGSLRG